MPRKDTPISVSSNNEKLVELFLAYQIPDIKFVKDKDLHQAKYAIYIADLNSDLLGLSQQIISLLQLGLEKKVKTAICVLFQDHFDTEKITYLRNLLESTSHGSSLVRLCFIRDLYQDHFSFPVTYLDDQFSTASRTRRWKASVKGKNALFPLHLSDLIPALLKILFLDSTAGRGFFLCGDKISDVELGFLIKRILGDEDDHFEIETVLPDQLENSDYLSSANETQISLNWRPDVDISQKLKQIFAHNSQSSTDSDFLPQPDSNGKPLGKLISKLRLRLSSLSPHHLQIKIQNRLVAYIVKLLGFILIAYLISTVVFVWSLTQELGILGRSLEHVRQGRLNDSVTEIEKIKSIEEIRVFAFEPLRPLIQLLSPTTNEELNNLFAFNKYVSLSLENLQQTYVLAEKIYLSLNDSQSSLDMEGSILALQSNLGLVYGNIHQIKLTLDSKRLPASVTKKINASSQIKQIDLIESQVSQTMKLLEILPQILTSDGTKKIGILVQDQDELRPTGGVIKQLIVVTLENGKITNNAILDPAVIDSSSEGIAKAPEMLSRVLGEDEYFFKNMNYAADFSQTGRYITSFLNRTLSVDLDVLIGLNKSLFEKLLSEDKAIEIAGKNYTASSLRSSSSDTDVSLPVVQYYLNQFKSGRLSLIPLGRTLLQEIEQGNLLLFSRNEQIQTVLSRLPLSGMVTPYACHSGLSADQNCLSQTTYLSEANLTLAPLNHSIKRDTVHSIIINSQSITHEYSLTYNFFSDFSILNRSYRVVYQLFVPIFSSLSKIELDGAPLVQESSPINLKHGTLEYFQIPISFVANGSHQVKITIETPLQETLDLSKTALSFTEIRQPGLSDQGIVLKIKTPESLRPQVISHPIKTDQGFLVLQLPPKTTTFGLRLGL